MAETTFCTHMRNVAEVYNMIINAANRFNMKGTSLPQIVVVGTEVSWFLLNKRNFKLGTFFFFNLATASQLR